MKKDHLEIILERMDSKFDLVIESQDAVNKKIDNVQASLDEHKQENKKDQRLILQMIKEVSQKTKELDNKVTDFRKENEAAHTALNKKLDARKKETVDIKRRVSRLEAAPA